VKKLTIVAAVCVGVLSMGVATATAAKPSDEAQAAKRFCVQQKQADKAAFTALWGKNAMRNCKRDARGEVAEAARNSAQECRSEQEADPAAFTATYGTNPNGKNAFGKCVSQKSKAELSEEVTEFKNAAKECRSEQDADAAAFAETYGTNGNKKNAFGKCVSSKVSDEDETDDETEDGTDA